MMGKEETHKTAQEGGGKKAESACSGRREPEVQPGKAHPWRKLSGKRWSASVSPGAVGWML